MDGEGDDDYVPEKFDFDIEDAEPTTSSSSTVGDDLEFDEQLIPAADDIFPLTRKRELEDSDDEPQLIPVSDDGVYLDIDMHKKRKSASVLYDDAPF